MVAGQHKLSRRALLAGACVAPVLDPLAFPGAGLRRDEDEVSTTWRLALACWSRAEAEVAGLAGPGDEDAYDSACGRHDAALAGVLGAAAPDGAAAVWKLELILEHRAFELDCWDAAVAVLAQDVRRLSEDGRF